MDQLNFSHPKMAIVALAIIIATSCNNNPSDIPFPVKDSGYAQPVSVPLQFTAPKKINWVITKTGGIHPSTSKLDIDTLPSSPYDTAGFRPFPQPPGENHFNFNSLPSSAFNLDKLPSKQLNFKTSLLARPATMQTTRLVPKGGTPLSIYDVGPLQGLDDARTSSLLMDKSGLMWIATAHGIYRYDGENMLHYIDEHFAFSVNSMVEDDNGRIWYVWENGTIEMIDPKNGTRSRCGDTTAARKGDIKLFKDDKGLIWVSSQDDKGLIIIDPVKETFKRVNKSDGLSFANTYGMFEDSSNNIWVTTLGGGIDIINRASGRVKYFKKTDGLGNDTVLAITAAGKGNVLLAVKGGIDEADIQSGLIKHYTKQQGLKEKYAYGLLFDNKGQIWRGMGKGVEILDPVKGMIKLINQQSGLSGNDLYALLADNSQRVWVATWAGLNIVGQNGESVYPAGKTGVSTLLKDHEGRIWIGATGDGIEILDPQKRTAKYLKKLPGIRDGYIQNINEPDSNIWVISGNDRQGLDVIDPFHKTIERIGRKEGLGSDTVYAMFRDNRGSTWISGPTGIDIIDPSKATIKHAGIAQGLDADYFLSIKQDKQGLVWLSTSKKNGVGVVDPENGYIKYLNNAPGLKDTCVRFLLPDESGRMWIVTDKGLYAADAKQGTLTNISATEGLPDNQINSILEWKGSIIASAKNGVSIITPPQTNNAFTAGAIPGKWKIAPLNNAGNLVKQLTTIRSNFITKSGRYLWGDSGITVINDIMEDTGHKAIYITNISLFNQVQYFVNSPLLKQNDTLWAEDTFYIKGQTPVNRGFIQRHGLSWDSVTGPYNMPVNLKIPYDQNAVQFQFGQANLGTPDTTWYCYILQGINKQWSVFTSNTFSENYSNLPPGKYVFKVSCKCTNGSWGQPAAFTFTITPPWWLTWWAYMMYILFVSVTGLGAFAYLRNKRLKNENIVLEQKIKLRTAEVLEQKEQLMAQRDHLEKTLTELKAAQKQLVQAEKMASLGELTAGIAHEIQNPLNFVNNFSEVSRELMAEMKDELKAGNNSEAASLADDIEQNLEKIDHHGRRADAIVKGMLQHSRKSTGQIELTDINALADEYLRLSYHGLRAKDKDFNAALNTYFDNTIGKINIIPQDIGRVLLNLFNNAFYAVGEKKRLTDSEGFKNFQGLAYRPALTLTTKRAGNTITVSIADNGNGIPQSIINKIFQPFFTTKPTGQGTGLGLSLSYDIVKAHGGEIRVETKEGEGTEFIIILPFA
jgi:signal transduction histidine kinase/ligand-binding sensor domain-containing protein